MSTRPPPRVARLKSIRLERQLAGLDLGEIQDVVDDAEQRRRLDDLDLAKYSRCFGVRSVSQQQIASCR